MVRAGLSGIAGGDRRGTRRRAGLEVIERDGHYHVHGTIRVKDRSRRVRHSTGLVAAPAHKGAAEEIRRQIEAEIRDELLYGIHPSVPLSAAAEAYLARRRHRPLNPVDIARIQELDRKFGPRKLSAITEAEWAAYIDARTAGNAPATRERFIDLVMGFLKWCQKRPRNWLRELPTIERNRDARYRPRRRARRVAELTPELIARLVDHAPPHMKGQIAILWATGARVSSVLYGCRLCDYLAAPGREQITFHNTKNGLPVVATVDPWCAGLMAEYLTWRGRLHDREGPLFLTDSRKPYGPHPKGGGGQIKTAFRGTIRRAGTALRREALTESAALRRVGRYTEARTHWHRARAQLEILAQLTPHWFRHLLATDMATRIIDGMEQGGWLDIRSFKGYSHDVPDRRREAMNARP
jgi:hypothetical protein